MIWLFRFLLVVMLFFAAHVHVHDVVSGDSFVVDCVLCHGGSIPLFVPLAVFFVLFVVATCFWMVPVVGAVVPGVLWVGQSRAPPF